MMLANYIGAIAIIVIGFYAMISKRDIIKIVVGMGIVDYGLNLMIVSICFNEGGTAPIFTFGELVSGMYFVDPVPQALTLTSIVIGACVTAMALALCVRIYKEYGTLDSASAAARAVVITQQSVETPVTSSGARVAAVPRRSTSCGPHLPKVGSSSVGCAVSSAAPSTRS